MDSDIAIDFKEYLEDLKVNSKPEIDTLTLIARENPSHAQAISKVLEEHINKVGHGLMPMTLRPLTMT